MLRIAQVAPLYESVPPKMYGGTERVVYNLTEQLVKMGHDVTLFASGDSHTSACLVAGCSEALRLGAVREPLAPHLLMFEKLKTIAKDFDVVHFHNEYCHFPFARYLQDELGVATLSTMHGRLDLPEYRDLFFAFDDLPAVSISLNQREPLPFVNWAGVVYHGMDSELLTYNPAGGEYLAFLGRISPEKGVERAIEIAVRTGMKLKVAAKIDRVDGEYYRGIQHLFEHPLVEFIGEIGDREKPEFLGRAKALLFPINWPEPFGLVMIEAMATGTPVIAFRNGSVPEVIRDGFSGYIVNSVDEACDRVRTIDQLRRADCRAEFMERFTIERMGRDYVQIYRRLMQRAGSSKHRPSKMPSAIERGRHVLDSVGDVTELERSVGGFA